MYKADITTISHEEHRYPTVGDYAVDAFGVRHFRISDMGNTNYEFLVAMHELIEEYLVTKRNISHTSIDTFDIRYENNRPDGDESEPGNDPKAPYYNEHQFATKIEKQLADELGVNWDEYDKTVVSL